MLRMLSRVIFSHSRTWRLPGWIEVSRPGSFGERFSSNSNFMGQNAQPPVPVRRISETSADVLGG